jgi:archaellum component FlaG (FlaF/FlaG flagellin family)
MNAVTDMTEVYNGALAKAIRGIAIVDRKYVVIRDEVEALDTATTVRWTLLTPATVKITGKNTLELTSEGKQLTLLVNCSAAFTMKTWSTDPPNDYDAPNPGTALAGFEVTLPANTKTAITVSLVPGKSNVKTFKKIPALKDWNK